MNEITMVGLDLAKNAFQLHGVDGQGHQRLARQVKRGQLMNTIAQLPRCTIAMEACAGAHLDFAPHRLPNARSCREVNAQ
jgi:transposase